MHQNHHHHHHYQGASPKSHKHKIPYMCFCASIWDNVCHHCHHHHHHHIQKSKSINTVAPMEGISGREMSNATTGSLWGVLLHLSHSGRLIWAGASSCLVNPAPRARAHRSNNILALMPTSPPLGLASITLSTTSKLATKARSASSSSGTM